MGSAAWLTFACANYDRVKALHEGKVQVDGYQLAPVVLPPMEIFRRVLTEAAFDIAEMSCAWYTMARDRGEDTYVALPIFVSRAFRHGSLYVPESADTGDLKGYLRGARIGASQYSTTTAVWVRSLLEAEFGVDLNQTYWVLTTDADIRGTPFYQNHRHRFEVADRPLFELLRQGGLDLLISIENPVLDAGMGSRGQQAGSRPLFPDLHEAEWRGFERTGHFPVMHTIVVRQSLIAQDAALPAKLVAAFQAAKEMAYRAFDDTGAPPLAIPGLMGYMARVRALMGHDFWPYGLEENRRTLEHFLATMWDQGLLHRRWAVEDLFLP